jgi:vacuolar-type H+-ATPase subunit H
MNAVIDMKTSAAVDRIASAVYEWERATDDARTLPDAVRDTAEAEMQQLIADNERLREALFSIKRHQEDILGLNQAAALSVTWKIAATALIVSAAVRGE